MTSMEYSYQPERANWFTRFLWHSAGADSQLLNRCPKSDQVKYECLGGLVLSTSVLAFMSGGYAMFVVFSQKSTINTHQSFDYSIYLTVAVGIIWAAIIYNIERFIVSSLGRIDDNGAITFAKLSKALPRLVLSVAVGIVLAVPLELRVLKSEIDETVRIQLSPKLLQIEREYEASKSKEKQTDYLRQHVPENKLSRLQIQLNEIERQIEIKRSMEVVFLAIESNTSPDNLTGNQLRFLKKLEQYKQEGSLNRKLPLIKRDFDRDLYTGYDKNADGILGESERGLVDRLNRLKLLKDSVISNNKYKSDVVKVDNAIREFLRQCDVVRNEKRKTVLNSNGLVNQVSIVHNNRDYERIAVYLRIMLIVIETSPMFFKMMLSRSTYEVLLDSQQRISSAQQGVLRGGLVTLDGRLVPTSEMSIAASAYEAELRRRSETEARLADEVHRVVRERTAEEIREHPEDYYSRYGTSTSGTRHSPAPGTSPRSTAYTSGPIPSDPYGRRFVDDPSGAGSTDTPSGPDPGMGFVGTGGVSTGSSTGTYYVRSREAYERFVAITPTVEPWVIPTETSVELSESHSSESTPVVGAADSSTSAGLSTGEDTSTIVADETTTSGSTTSTYVDADSAVVDIDSAFESSSSSVDLETVVTPLFTEAVSEESLGHEEVVSPAVVILDDSELEFAVAGLVTADDSTSRSVDSISDADASEPDATTSLDSSITRVVSETLWDSSADVTSAGSIDESVAADHPDTYVSGPLDEVIPSEGEISNYELLLTTVSTEDLPVDDTPGESPATDVDPRTTRTPDTHEPASV